MTTYALKAAPRFPAQLLDRIRQFQALGLPPFLELHCCGLDELDSSRTRLVRACQAHSEARYSLHFPLFDAGRGYIYDMAAEDETRLDQACALCNMVGAEILVMHRSWFAGSLVKPAAEQAFLGKARRWAAFGRGRGVRVLFENWGHVWLPEAQGGGFLASPLDHFFPWELKRFHAALAAEWKDTGIVLDLAHAVLSSNMFNMLQAHPELRRDPRFPGITDEDLAQAESLDVADFLLDFVDYVHVSDAWVWDPGQGLGRVDDFLHKEGLPLGSGTMDYRRLAPLLDGRVLVMEIEPPDGDHAANPAQGEAVRLLRGLAAKEN